MSEETKTGVKHDKDPNEKPKITLIPLKALWEVAKVMTFGAQKYGRFNWKGGIDYSRLADAACRHIIQFMEGEDNDKEFGLSHLAHAACSILMLLEETTMNKPELDDRYKTEAIDIEAKTFEIYKLGSDIPYQMAQTKKD